MDSFSKEPESALEYRLLDASPEEGSNAIGGICVIEVLQNLFVLALAELLPQDRAPIPDAAALKEATKLVRDIFKDDYAKRGPADRIKLAVKLLEQGLATKDDLAASYVTLQEARGLASEVGEIATALRAVEELAARFEVNRLLLKHASLSTASLSARDPAQMSNAADLLAALAEEAVAGQELEIAEKSLNSALMLSKGARNAPLTGRLGTKLKELSDLKPKFATAQKAKETLKTAPDDPPANLVIGRFNCFVLGNWDAGLPHLAKGSDAILKALASQDQPGLTDPSGQIALADAWWEFGDKEGGKGRDQARSRAYHWYQNALPRLTGLAKAKAEKRLGEAPPRTPGGPSIDLFRLIDPKQDTFGGAWSRSGKSLVTPPDNGMVEIPYAMPPEYDLLLKAERKSENRVNLLFLVLPLPEGKVGVSIDQEETGDVTGLSKIDGKLIAENGTKYQGRLLKKDIPSTIHCSVRRTGVSLHVDGKRIFDWKGELRRLSIDVALGTHPNTPTIANQAQFHLTALELIPVGDPGKPLR